MSAPKQGTERRDAEIRLEQAAATQARTFVSESDGHLDCWHCSGSDWCLGCTDLRDRIAAALVDWYRNGRAESEPALTEQTGRSH